VEDIAEQRETVSVDRYPVGPLELMEVTQFLRIWSEDGVNEDVEE
jgi:hypothetical protein